MIKLEYDDKGNLIAYKDGEPVGKVVTMGDACDDQEKRKDSE